MLDGVTMEKDNQHAACALPDIPLSLESALRAKGLEFPHIHLCHDWGTLKRIGRLRHEQYVARQGKNYPSVVQERNCLIEFADFSSINLYAKCSGRITSAIRVGRLADSLEPQAAWLQHVADRLAIPPTLSLTCTRLVRDPDHSGRHAAHLIDFIRLKTVRAGYRYCVMQTAAPLLSFFQKFDFFDTGIWSDDEVAGRLSVLILDTRMQPRRTMV